MPRRAKKSELPAEPVEVFATLDASIETAFEVATNRFADILKGGEIPTKYRRNAREAALVRTLAGHGDSAQEIATTLGHSEEIITKFYSRELAEGEDIAKSKVRKKIFDLCMEGDKDMLKLYAKTQLGWTETKKVKQEIDVNVLTKEQRDAMVRAQEDFIDI